MKQIPLTNSKVVALVDDDVYEELSKYKWADSKGYASRTKHIGFIGKKHIVRRISMHRIIMEAGDGQLVDHINRNRADNRRENLRFATYSQNEHHRIVENKTGYRGVFHSGGNCWTARIKKDGKAHTKSYKTLLEAAHGYDELSKQYYGERAMLNFPNG